MGKGFQQRRGNSDQHSLFNGEPGEITINTDRWTVVVQDGTTNGGYEHVNLNANQRLTNKDIVANQLSVAGVSTFSGITTVTGPTLFSKQLNVSGVSTFNGNVNVGTAVTIYASAGVVSATSFRGDGSALTGLTTSRFTVSNNTGSIGAGTTADITITGAKTYSLLKINTSHAAWVRIYTDTTSRTNDATRLYTTDPTPGSGVLAEVYTATTGSNTFKMTPGVVGWNDDGTPSTNIYAKVTNNESGAADITVSLTIVRMED